MSFDYPSFAIPLWSLLAFYGFYLVFFFLYTGFNLYHLLRFGTYGIGLYLICALFLGGTVMLVAVSYTLLAPFDWTSYVPISAFFEQFTSDQFFPGI